MFSLSTLEADVQAAFVRTEAAVQAIVVDCANELEVGIAKLQGAGNWLASNAPAIASGIETAVTFATALGAPVSPALVLGVQAASAALTEFASAHNAGQSTPSSIVQGYLAYTTAAGLTSQVKAAAITAKANTVLSAVGTVATAVVTATSGSTSAAGQATNTAAQAIVGEVSPGAAIESPATPVEAPVNGS